MNQPIARPQESAIPDRYLNWDLILCGISLALLYFPTYWHLAQNNWVDDEQSHGPIILALSIWLLYRDRGRIFSTPTRPAQFWGFTFLMLGVAIYAVGRSQSIQPLEVGSQIIVLAALLLILKGWSALRIAWFPLFFMLFMVPLPGGLVQMVTMPLKLAVSTVAEFILYQLNYPIARTGVILSVGQYQLLVADACSGLNSMFTLESLGLLYMKLMDYQSKSRNMMLAAAIIPISFAANVTRVIILVLITYYMGDEAGQGFMHGFAGMVLFLTALTLMLVIDKFFIHRVELKRIQPHDNAQRA
jgi:exosortase B